MAQNTLPQVATGDILLNQLQETQSVQGEWFVPLRKALQDLSFEQAAWAPGDSSHSVAQLASHLLFWNTRGLHAFQGIKEEPHKGSNAETFSLVNASGWNKLVKELDALCQQWEETLAQHKDKLNPQQIKIVSELVTHNTYHTGQIMYVRKLQQSWDASKGVH